MSDISSLMDKKEVDLFANQANSTTKKKESSRVINPTAVIVAVVILIVLVIFVVRPAVLGYGVYQQAQASNLDVQDYAQSMQQLSQDLEVVKANLSTYSTFTGALLAQVDQKSNELTDCKVQLERVQSDVQEAQKQTADKDAEIAKVKSESQTAVDQQVTEKTAALEQQKTDCQSSLTTKETEVGAVQAKYDQLLKNAAKSICCKAKVDNPQINFYDVVDGKISCLEQGTNQLSC